MKIAASLDGRTALSNGVSKWITGDAARADAHRWRARSCAVLTGIGTLRDDDPKLTVRAVATSRQPLKVLIDSRLEATAQAQLFAEGRALVFCARPDAEKLRALQDKGAEVIELADARGKVDLAAMAGELARRGLNEVLIEAGVKLNGSLLRAGLIDELLLYFAPCLLGDKAQGMFDLPDLGDLSERREWRIREAGLVGADLRVLARPAG